MRGEVSYQLW